MEVIASACEEETAEVYIRKLNAYQVRESALN